MALAPGSQDIINMLMPTPAPEMAGMDYTAREAKEQDLERLLRLMQQRPTARDRIYPQAQQLTNELKVM